VSPCLREKKLLRNTGGGFFTVLYGGFADLTDLDLLAPRVLLKQNFHFASLTHRTFSPSVGS